MSRPADTGVSAGEAELRSLHEARARAELAAADSLAPGSDAVAWRGALFADVVLVKGLPGPAEATGGAALSGADGEAAAKSLERLGWDPATAFFTLSRPVAGLDADRRAARLRAQIEAIDPSLVIALDGEALDDVSAAFGVARPSFGDLARVSGRRIVGCDGLEASLTDPARKQRVWRQLKVAVPEGPVY